VVEVGVSLRSHPAGLRSFSFYQRPAEARPTTGGEFMEPFIDSAPQSRRPATTAGR